MASSGVGQASGAPVMTSLQGLPLQHKLQGLSEPEAKQQTVSEHRETHRSSTQETRDRRPAEEKGPSRG